MKCPKCGGITFLDENRERYSLCGWREPIVPFDDAMSKPANHAHKTLNKYEELLKREARSTKAE